MDLVDNLSPAEVLTHLRDMGYHNITPQQLKEFVTDLKKLIVYDQLSSSSGSSSSLSSSSSSESDYFSSHDTLSDSSGDCSRLCESKRPHPSRQQNVPQANCSKPASSVSSRCSMKRNSVSSSSLSKRPIEQKNLPLRRERTKSISEQNLEEIVKPKTSFIRSWKLQGKQSAPQKPATNDPVKLYHHYQSLWAKHKCPGEDSRAELRWLVREKMLGQDPHLYSKNMPVRKSSR